MCLFCLSEFLNHLSAALRCPGFLYNWNDPLSDSLLMKVVRLLDSTVKPTDIARLLQTMLACARHDKAAAGNGVGSVDMLEERKYHDVAVEARVLLDETRSGFERILSLKYV